MSPRVAIIDYGVGNLFSVAQACKHAGLAPVVTASPQDVTAADGVILPGIGAFGFAMNQLRALRMVDSIGRAAASGKPLLGICLGFQLLFQRSLEMGATEGLSLFEGEVTPLNEAVRRNGHGGKVRSPNVSWLPVRSPGSAHGGNDPWAGTLLESVAQDERMYFVHSYFASASSSADVLATSSYYDLQFCCAVGRGNIFGCQFHPEKSATGGLKIYKNLAGKLGVT